MQLRCSAWCFWGGDRSCRSFRVQTILVRMGDPRLPLSLQQVLLQCRNQQSLQGNCANVSSLRFGACLERGHFFWWLWLYFTSQSSPFVFSSTTKRLTWPQSALVGWTVACPIRPASVQGIPGLSLNTSACCRV